jgi:predicted nucleic acid-binding protein
VQPLTSIPPGSDIFIDANIFVYGLSNQSAQCLRLLERCSREEVIGISLFEIVNEATHKFMLAEASSKHLIAQPGRASELRQKFSAIPALTDYWRDTEKILALNLLFCSTNEQIVRSAQSERQRASLLTNDSMIMSCMREYGISYLATADGDFDRANGITVFTPNDL